VTGKQDHGRDGSADPADPGGRVTSTDASDLAEAWHAAEAALPSGWQLDGLRCSSTGLLAEERSDEWIAVAVAADGTERAARAADPHAALDALVASLAGSSGSPEPRSGRLDRERG
jgi:hypothetical protein